MKAMFHVMSAVALLVAVAVGCTFKFAPVEVPHYYRAEGWFVPGTEDVPSAIPDLHLLPPSGNVPGATAYVMRHESPYIVQFPPQVFMLNGTRQKMDGVFARAAVIRIEMNGRVVAYSYGLVPVSAHKKQGKWVIDSAAACIFYATFIDDKGDGIFRDLIPAPFNANVVPSWVKQGNS